jgi:hypothetical protein
MRAREGRVTQVRSSTQQTQEALLDLDPPDAPRCVPLWGAVMRRQQFLGRLALLLQPGSPVSCIAPNSIIIYLLCVIFSERAEPKN